MERLRLIIIDDDELDRLAVKRALSETSGKYEFEEFATGEEGLERLVEGEVDCVLLDYSLPGASGLEVLDKLGSAGLDIPTIMLTGRGDEELVVESIRRGAHDYLSKEKLDGDLLRSKVVAVRRLHDARQRTQTAEAELHDSVAQLQRALVSRDSVLAVVSHDLRGHLNNIELAMSLLDQDHVEEQHELAIHSVRRALARANRLINDLLDVAQLSGGALHFDKRPLDPRSIAEAAASEFQAVARQRGVTLNVEIDDSLGRILADSDRVHQILDNLLRNALKHGGEGGEVQLEVLPGDDAIEFAVRDHGPGLDEEAKAHVFDRFWQADKRDSSTGSGLGLAIAKGLVEAHGGEIGVETPAGGGARFWFTIPLA